MYGLSRISLWWSVLRLTCFISSRVECCDEIRFTCHLKYRTPVFGIEFQTTISLQGVSSWASISLQGECYFTVVKLGWSRYFTVVFLDQGVSARQLDECQEDGRLESHFYYGKVTRRVKFRPGEWIRENSFLPCEEKWIVSVSIIDWYMIFQSSPLHWSAANVISFNKLTISCKISRLFEWKWKKTNNVQMLRARMTLFC